MTLKSSLLLGIELTVALFLAFWIYDVGVEDGRGLERHEHRCIKTEKEIRRELSFPLN